MIDKNSPIPIYFQIAEYLKKKITSHQYEVDQAIPSERELCEAFNVSRMTVRQALNNLVNEGYIYREKGKGTFVATEKIDQPLHGLTSFSEDMKKRGLTPRTRIMNFTQTGADLVIASRLKINENDPVYQIQRIRLADEAPIAIENSYLPVQLIPDLTERHVHESIYAHLEQDQHFEISHAEQTIEAGLADNKQATLLNVKSGSPTLLINRLTYLADEQPIEWVQSIYRGDRYKFHVNIKRQNN